MLRASHARPYRRAGRSRHGVAVGAATAPTSSSACSCFARHGSRSASSATIRGRPRTRSRSAAAWEMLQRNDWLIPSLARRAHASASRRWCHGCPRPALALFAAVARRARRGAGSPSALLLALLLAFTGAASRELNGRAFRWLPVLILVGSVGFWDRAHELSPELGLAVAVAMALYGVALALRRPAAGGVALGLGIGHLVPAHRAGSGRSGARAGVAAARIRTRHGAVARYARHARHRDPGRRAAGRAWPSRCSARSRTSSRAWWRVASPGDCSRPGSRRTDRRIRSWLREEPVWFAWPALPLILWMLWMRGRGFNGGLASRA